MGKLMVVVGGQYGSEAKGAVAAHLSRGMKSGMVAGNESKPLAIRVAGPNAGHTVYDDNGVKFPLRHIPVAAAVREDVALALAAGSEIDHNVLLAESDGLELNGHDVWNRLYIDEQATRIYEEHIEAETRTDLTGRIGSTGKGIGAARADRIMREADIWGGGVNVADIAAAKLDLGADVLIEGTQGYGLGLHAGHYPQCTSSDCRAIDFLSMAGVNPWQADELEVWVVLRTYPIRVAGNSGGMGAEISWEELARRTGGYIQPERTTVTQKIRRIAEWDPELAGEAIRANGGPGAPIHVALMFLDYLDPTCAGATRWDQLSRDTQHRVHGFEDELGNQVWLLGTGPTSIIDRRV